MTDFRFFPRIFGDVMTAVRAEYDPIALIKPVYEFGAYGELTKIHTLDNSNVKTKFPLVWLVWDAVESTKTWENSSMYSVNPRIFICVETNSDYSSDERYTASFENVLYPIWDLIKDAIDANLNISYFSSKNFKDTEHLYWGDPLKEKNVLSDTLDALEIQFTDMKVYPGSC